MLHDPALDFAAPAHPFDGLKLGGYQVILADPPWAFETHSAKGQGKSASQHYDVQSLEDISRWPVADLADPRGCLLVMWCTWPLVARGVHTDICRRLGFEPSSGGVWAKVTTNGLPCFGTGYVLRDACEPYIIARRGKRIPAGLKRTERNLILAERREHSRKPDAMHAMLERLLPDAQRVELFAREPRVGWDVWGNQTNKFGGGVAHG